MSLGWCADTDTFGEVLHFLSDSMLMDCFRRVSIVLHNSFTV